jgi:hypothetical protein
MGLLKLAEDAPARPGLQPRHLIDKSPRELSISLLEDLSAKLGARKSWFTPSMNAVAAETAA